MRAYNKWNLKPQSRERKCLSVRSRIFRKQLPGKLAAAAILIIGFRILLGGSGTQAENTNGDRSTLGSAMLQELAAASGEMLYDIYMPNLSLAMESGHETYWILQEQIDTVLPFYGYLTEGLGADGAHVGRVLREIQLAEAQEGNLDWEDDLYIEDDTESGSLETGDNSLADLLQAENEAALQMRQGAIQEFVPHTRQTQVDLAPLSNYETLIKTFYTIDSNTMAGSDQLDVGKLMAKDMTISKQSDGPQILIYHTHSQEGFADSVPGDDSTNIQAVGEHLAQVLRDTYGYEVLHYTGEYDVESRNNAYANALPDISRVLAENPSIQVVIDLHRDEVPESTRLVMDLDGRPTARFMFFNGLSRTKKTGNIAYLYNANLDDNLAFSFQMQLKAAEYYPGLTRKIYLKGYRYNMHLASKYLLIELGAQNNTLEEAMNACDPLAHVLDMVLSGE